jgi:tRNA(His) guanylyltransferase
MKKSKILRNLEVNLLHDKMKGIEKQHDFKLELNKPFIIRVDGKNFSKFTKPFKKPFDINLHNCLIESSESLIKQYNPVLTYIFRYIPI